MSSMRYVLVVLALATSGSALAQGGTETDTFYCGQEFIEAGTSAADVLRLCGEPTSRISEDQWVYDRGPDKFTVTVYFEADGTVGRMDQQPRN